MHTDKNRVATTSVLAAIFLTLVKLVVGFATGSLGILSEAAHSGLDLVAAVVTAVAVRVSGKPADAAHTYGHGKVENFSALFETLLLLGTCGWIIYEAFHRLVTGNYAVEASIWSFVVMVTSIVVDINRSRMLYRAAKQYNSQALEADALHFSSDIWSSLVVIVGLVFVQMGLPLGDSIAAMGVALLVTIVSLRLAKRAIEALLDTAPAGVTEQVKSIVMQVKGVEECTLVRARQSGPTVFIDVQVGLAKDLPLDQVDALLSAVNSAIAQQLPEASVMVQPIPTTEAVHMLPLKESKASS